MAARPHPRPFAAFGVALLTVLALSGCTAEAPEPERVVLIVADTLRRDFVSPYAAGAKTPRVPTPNLEKLAERGTVFRNALSSFHQTTMSMSALFTGRVPSLETGDASRSLPWTSHSWCGMARLATSAEDSCIPAHLDTLAEDLQRAGFETIAVVSNRLLFRPLGYEQGFDTWIEVGEAEKPDDRAGRAAESMTRSGTKVNEQVLAALDARSGDRFFLYVHYIDPHDYGVRPDLPTYADGVRFLDTAVGELLAAFETRGLSEGTRFVFTSDHGELLGAKHALPANRKHFGNPSFEPLIRIPLIVAPPIERDPNELLRGQDLRALLHEIAGLAAQGVDSELSPDELFLTEQFYQTYRRGRFKSMWSRNGKDSALFDLRTDPGERVDVKARHPEVHETHRLRVAALTRELGSLHGSDAELSEDDAARLRALGYLGERLEEPLEEPDRE